MSWEKCLRSADQEASPRLLDEPPIVEELLTGDDVVLDGVEAHFLMLDALAAGLGGEFDRGVDREPAGACVGVAAEEGPPEILAGEGVVALKDLRFVDDRLLADEFPAVAFDGDYLRRDRSCA